MRIGLWTLTIVAALGHPAAAEEPLDVGSRLEPLVDRFLVERFSGDAAQRLHKPQPGEVVLAADRPWEGNTSAYFAIFQDGDRFRMYYRGSHFDEKGRRATHSEVTCYAESRDGIHWTKPDLGLFEFQGSKQNNIVWSGMGTHNFTPFRDANPACPPQARYKALATGHAKGRDGLIACQSSDGIGWTRISPNPVITKGAFDSQNLAFWDGFRGRYVDFHRGFRQGVRDIMTCTSSDFLHWTDPVWLEYSGAPREHLYTNAIMPYPGAPHLFIGFPTRFQPQRADQVEPTFMTSRDGLRFHRWTDPLIPVTAPEDRSGNRSNYMAWGLLQLPGSPQQWSVYGTEAYYRGPASRLRRFTYRRDGLVSVRASAAGGELLTRPLRFQGDRLVLNFTAAGEIRVEVQDVDGKPLDGFRLEDCEALRGDRLEGAVGWKSKGSLAGLGRPIRLRVVLRDADLYSLQFVGGKQASR